MDKRTLKQYCKLCDEIKELEAEKQSLVDGHIGAVKITGLPSGSILSDPTGTVGVMVAKIAEDIAEQLNRCIALRQDIEAVIASLDNPTERLLMRKRYIEGKTWERVAVEMNYSIDRIWHIHGDVLKKIKNATGNDR